MGERIDMEGGELMKRALDPAWHFMELGFRAVMATEFRRVCPDIRDPMKLASVTLKAFLADEGIGFGHRDYAWDHSAAVTLAREYEIAHWEQAQ